MRPVPPVEELRSIGTDAGLEAVGVAPATPFVSTRADLEERSAAGLAGGMQFTYRRPARSTDPAGALAGASALVVGARRYPAGSKPRIGRDPAGRVATYAREDHYAALRRGLEPVADRLEADGWRTQVVADDNALVDREAAVRAGLGWYGKNSNVLLPGAGSWFVLGSVITDAPLEAAASRVPDGCGSCRRCLDGCPTGAIVAPGVVDARRCLAWLVQAPGTIPREFRAAIGDRMYGCDDCQEVCPPNRSRSRDEAPSGGDEWVPVLEVLDASDDELLRRYGRWYIAERDPRYLRRNALVVLGNVGRADDPLVLAALCRYLGHSDPLLRAHAVWAVRRLGRDDLLDAVAGDPDPGVQAELV